MSFRTYKAHYDGKSILLDEPASLPPGREVLVVVPEMETVGEEREAWAMFSLQGLARAYGENEPEYTEADCIP